MEEFDVDEFLADQPETPEQDDSGFDPDAFLAEDDSGFNPDTFVEEAPEPRERMGAGEAGVAGFGQGGTFGFGDEISGFIGAALDRPVTYAMDRLQGVPEDLAGVPEDSTFGERYKESRDFARRYNKQAQEDQPLVYTGAEIGGALTTGAMLGAGSLPAIAAEGGAVGLGMSEADLTEGEFAEAAIDTGIGASLGPAIRYGGKAIKGVGKAVAGVEDDILKASKKELAKVLGTSENKIKDKTAEYLREAGVGSWDDLIRGKRKIAENLREIYDRPGVDKEAIIDAVKIADKANYGLINKIKQTSKKIDPFDLYALSKGPVGVALKKGRDVVASGVKVQAPRVSQTYRGVKQAVSDKIPGSAKRALKYGTQDTLKRAGSVLPAAQMYGIEEARNPDLAEDIEQEATYRINNYLDKVQGTPYQNLFGEDNQQNAVRHNLLMERDSEYRQLILNEQREE